MSHTGRGGYNDWRKRPEQSYQYQQNQDYRNQQDSRRHYEQNQQDCQHQAQSSSSRYQQMNDDGWQYQQAQNAPLPNRYSSRYAGNRYDNAPPPPYQQTHNRYPSRYDVDTSSRMPHWQERSSLELRGFRGVQVTADQLERSLHEKRKEDRQRALKNQVTEQLRAEQEKSKFGQKQVTLEGSDDDDEDPDMPVMKTVHSLYDEKPVVDHMIIVKQEKSKKKKKKKKHKRKRSSSTSSSDSSKSRRKKYRRGRHGEGDDKHRGESEDGEEGTSRAESNFDVTINPWKLLRGPKEWMHYKPKHLVIDTLASQDEHSDHQSEDTIPDYIHPNNAGNYAFLVFMDSMPKEPEEWTWRMLLSEPEESCLQNRQDRFFADRIMRNWARKAPERVFRNRRNDQNFADETKLSHAPCAVDEEGATPLNPVKQELEEHILHNITVEDYMHLKRSGKVSYEEAVESSLDNRHSILQAKVRLEPDDVSAWLELIDIQRDLHAKSESGDPNAPIQSMKRFLVKVERVLKEALEKVSKINPRYVELALKKVKLADKYYGVQSEEAMKEWNECEKKYINNLAMWRDFIKIRQNDSETFDLKQMLLMGPADRFPLIDRCIRKLTLLKDGEMQRNVPERIEQFLVDLLVHRCALLVSTGYIDKAVAMVQALAEFHFFRPANFAQSEDKRSKQSSALRLQKMRSHFREFWTSGVPRVGEPNANGWSNFEPSDVAVIQPEEHEQERLEQLWKEMQAEERKWLESYRARGLAPVEVRRRLEMFRTRFYWSPVHFRHDSRVLYEHESRIVSSGEVEQLLFTFSDSRYAQELIFKLFHILGVPIPGIHIETQESMLRQFSRAMFPSNSPNSRNLHNFNEFIEQFVRQIAESDQMDPARICTALVTNISHSSMEIDAKCAALKQFVRKDIQALRRYSKETRLDPEVQLALFVTVFEEMALVREEINEDEEIIGAVELEKCLQILIINLDDKHRSIWEIWATPRSGTNVEEMKRRERLFFLRFAVFMARQLPFSTEPGVKAPIRTKGRESIFAVVSKRDFILNLWYHGKIAQVPETSDTIEKAYDRIRERLMNPLTPMEDDPFHWIGDENEMVFELASYFFYEFPLDNDPRNRFEQFIATEDNSDLYLTKMALLLEDRAGPQETRARILQHIVSTTTFYSPGEFRRKLEQLVLRFPCNIPLLKAFLDVGNNVFKKYCFLAIHPGYDERSRLIRSSGHIYIALRKYKNEFKRSEEEENYEERALTGQLLQLIHFFKAIACENSDNLMPDDFIWTFLMRFVTNDGKGIVSPQCIDEIFALGQARCPWSKQFLIAALQGHSLSEEPFVRQINALIKQHGIKPYCSDAEAQLALQADQH